MTDMNAPAGQQIKHICDCGQPFTDLAGLEACQNNNHGIKAREPRQIELVFFVVFTIRYGTEEFEIEGIFSMEPDAEAFAVGLEAGPTVITTTIQQMTMPMIIDELIKGRIPGWYQTFSLMVEAQRIRSLVSEPGSSITLYSENDDFCGDEHAVDVSGNWTDWKNCRFSGSTMNVALQKALDAKNKLPELNSQEGA